MLLTNDTSHTFTNDVVDAVEKLIDHNVNVSK